MPVHDSGCKFWEMLIVVNDSDCKFVGGSASVNMHFFSQWVWHSSPASELSQDPK